MPDFFGEIAAGSQNGGRLPLITPEPPARSDKTLSLEKCDATPSRVYNKMKTKSELDAEIARLDKKYAPFSRRVAPAIKTTKTRTYLGEFDFSLGGGAWKKVTVPHYDGPVGKQTARYKTSFTVDKIERGRALFIHFDGVDYIAEVFVNGEYAGSHEGFFGAFEFDVTDFVKEGENELLVVVKNDFIYMGNATPEDPAHRIEGDKL